jgi:hypothetical protein
MCQTWRQMQLSSIGENKIGRMQMGGQDVSNDGHECGFPMGRLLGHCGMNRDRRESFVGPGMSKYVTISCVLPLFLIAD